MKVYSIIKKNVKLITRSRISALIILFGPLLIMLIVGLAFNNQASLRINVGYYTPQPSNLTDSFVQILKDANYNVKEYEGEEDCTLDIQSAENHVCVIFPADFEISNQKVNEIVFLVDNSKVNFFETVVDSIEQQFNQRAMQLTQGMTQELLNRLNETQESITNKSNVITNLKTDNSQLKTDVNAVKSEVDSLDLDFDYSDLNMDELEDTTDDLARSYRNAKTLAGKAVEEAESLMDDMDDEIDDLNISTSTKEDLKERINDTRDDIESLKEQLNETLNFNDGEVIDAVGDLKDDLYDVESRFKDAAQARDVTVNKIKSINQKLDQSLGMINAVEQVFNDIYSNIAGTEVTDINAITNPITKRVENVVTEQSQLNFYFPYLIVLIIMFIGLLLSSTLVIMEKTSRAHFRNFVTPTSDITFIFGTYITTFMVMLLQLFIVLGLYSVYFKENISSNFWAAFVVLTLLVTFFAWLGMIIGNIFNTEETGTLASISIGSILLFISDLIFPLERMPDTVAFIARTYNPFVIGSEMLRKTMLLDNSLGMLGQDLIILMVYLVGMFGLITLTHKVMKRTSLLRWGGYVARRELRLQQKHSELIKIYERYIHLDEKDYFETKNGSKLKDLGEVISFIEKLDEDTFREYVNDDANLFADWIMDTLGNADLSQTLRATKSKKKSIKILVKGIKAYDRMKHRHEKHHKKHKH